jgi:putative transposase
MLSRGDSSRKTLPHLPNVDRKNQPTIIFLTVCTKNREPRLANEETHQVLLAHWLKSTSWLVGRYVILPDHIHLFCSPHEDVPLERWVAFWKNISARALRIDDQPFWQRDFWDAQLRSSDSYEQKWEYVRYNPVRHKLCLIAADWPYQGEIHQLHRRED